MISSRASSDMFEARATAQIGRSQASLGARVRRRALTGENMHYVSLYGFIFIT